MFVNIILAVLLFLAICVIVYLKGQMTLGYRALEAAVSSYEREISANNAAWEQGRDELEEMYQGQYLTLQETYEACHNALEATTEELEQSQEELDVMTRGYREDQTSLENLHRLAEHKDNQLTLAILELEKYEELYGEAATELLDTHNEIDKIAKEVHDWVQPKGNPFG